MITRKNMIITLDTETCGLNDPIYDIGWTIADKKGAIVSQYHALVKEVFTDGARMTKAYFAKKVFTDYAEMLDGQKIRLVPWLEIISILRDQIDTYNVNIVAAYNLGFDKKALGITSKHLGTGQILTKPIKMLDLWQFSCETFLNSVRYKKLAIQKGWVSQAGNIQTNAQAAYRFLTGNPYFEEDHTALSDALIETEILAKCFSAKSKIPYGVINAQP